MPAHPDGHPGELCPEEAILDQLQGDAFLRATGEWDASAGARRDAVADAHPEQPLRLDGDAGKLADPVPDVRAPDGQVLPPARLAQPVEAAPCIPDEVRSEGRSCAATAHAIAQPEPLV